MQNLKILLLIKHRSNKYIYTRNLKPTHSPLLFIGQWTPLVSATKFYVLFKYLRAFLKPKLPPSIIKKSFYLLIRCGSTYF